MDALINSMGRILSQDVYITLYTLNILQILFVIYTLIKLKKYIYMTKII